METRKCLTFIYLFMVVSFSDSFEQLIKVFGLLRFSSSMTIFVNLVMWLTIISQDHWSARHWYLNALRRTTIEGLIHPNFILSCYKNVATINHSETEFLSAISFLIKELIKFHETNYLQRHLFGKLLEKRQIIIEAANRIKRQPWTFFKLKPRYLWMKILENVEPTSLDRPFNKQPFERVHRDS